MIATTNTQAKSNHPLARFVTKDAIAALLNRKTEDIYRIDCWRYVIHVVGRGVSTFVSYADLPPILGVEPPTNQDFIRWRKRWQKNKKQAPPFWVDFYKQKFREASTKAQLYDWGKIVGIIKFGLSPARLQELRIVYSQKRLAFSF
jgi:hypothetical protein